MAKTTIKLPERFDINQVEQIQSRMSTTLGKEAEHVEVSAHSVRMIDSCCMQLLLSFINAAQASGKTVNIIKQSEEFSAATELLGVMTLINKVS